MAKNASLKQTSVPFILDKSSSSSVYPLLVFCSVLLNFGFHLAILWL